MRGISVIQKKASPIETERAGAQIPCFIGQAPIWQVDDVNWKNLAGKAMLINNTDEMKEKTGFIKPESGAWPKEASLCCAAVYATEVMLISPIIILINKQTIAESEEKTATAIFTGGEAQIGSTKVILSSVTVTGKVKGTDYTVAYDENGSNVIITALTEMTEEEVKYKEAEVDELKFSEDTFEELDFFEQEINVVPAVFGCPLWESEIVEGSSKTVGHIMMEAIQSPLNGHWYTQGYVNLDGDTINDAKKSVENYRNYKIKACWPNVCKDNRIYPMSVVFMTVKEIIDNEAGGVPYISASNEGFEMDYLCTKTGEKIRLKEADSTGLNDAGITTANFSDMQWVTWGVCMSNYEEENVDKIDADQLNDVAVQMKDYVSNLFQQTYARQLDKPMTKRQANDIVVSFQGKLDALVTTGALVRGKTEFLTSNNSASKLANGTFTFTITETNTPPGKAIIGEVSYDAEALVAYYADGGEE